MCGDRVTSCTTCAIKPSIAKLSLACRIAFLSAGNSVRQNLRRAGFAFFGIFNGTEFNPHFFEEVAKAVDRQKGAVLVCGIGGVLSPLGQGGRQSRLAACHSAPGFAEQTLICQQQPRSLFMSTNTGSEKFPLQYCPSPCCAFDSLLADIHRCTACRSLMAAYELASTGYQKVSILQGGFYEWERSGR